jgi:uncharacterized protein YndB with AHSA1/START domain
MAPIKEVTFDRTFDAPLEKVWQAWTDPEMIKQWWGPDNVLIPECEVDLRVGGRIYIVMEAGEAMGPYKGTRWPMEGTFTVVEPHTKFSYDVNAWVEGKNENGETNIDQTTEVVLAEENGKTKLHIKATIHKTGPGAGMAVQGMQAGFTQQLDKLTAFLAKA